MLKCNKFLKKNSSFNSLYNTITVQKRGKHDKPRFKGSPTRFNPLKNKDNVFFIDRKRANAKTHLWNPRNIWKDDILPDNYFPPFPTIPIHEEQRQYPDGMTWSRKTKTLPKLIQNRKFKHPEFDDATVETLYKRMYDPSTPIELPQAHPVSYKDETLNYPVYVPEPRCLAF